MDPAITLIVIAAVLGILMFTRASPDLVLMGALGVLLVTGVLTPARALEGFSNPGVLTIAMLYILAAALQQTGVVRWLADNALGQPRGTRGACLRLAPTAAGLSAFMNNTTVVAMFIPAVRDWARRIGVAPSQLLIPLSYLAILGGTVTLIGTSTNLVVDGLLQSSGQASLGLFDIAAVGLPVLAAGTLVLVLFAPVLLPQRRGLDQQLEDLREYSVDMRVPEGSPLAGKTLTQANLRHLGHGYLTEIERDDELLTAVSGDTRIAEKDVLRFIGEPRCANEVRQIRGLAPASHAPEKLDLAHHQRCLVEVVLSPDFPGIGESVRDMAFRTRYKAAILAVSRHGQTLRGKPGDFTLQFGDTLLLEASPEFVEQYRYRRDFLVVNRLNDTSVTDHSKAPLAVAILLTMVGLNVAGFVSVFEAALLAAGLSVLSGCLSATQARRSIDYPVLIVIAAAFSLGNAMTDSGAAQIISQGMLDWGLASPLAALFAVYVLTAVFTEFITNNAAAVLVFPIALAISESLGLSMLPFAIAIMIAASASFLTPLGYQTNLMVMGPGGYRFRDYVPIGLPMTLAVGTTAMVVIPLAFPF